MTSSAVYSRLPYDEVSMISGEHTLSMGVTLYFKMLRVIIESARRLIIPKRHFVSYWLALRRRIMAVLHHQLKALRDKTQFVAEWMVVRCIKRMTSPDGDIPAAQYGESWCGLISAASEYLSEWRREGVDNMRPGLGSLYEERWVCHFLSAWRYYARASRWYA